MIELLAPAGNYEKLMTALHFGADAVYLSGKDYGLRAFTDNFDEAELALAADTLHGAGRRMYVTLNVFAHNADFGGLREYLAYLAEIGADGIIVSDPGIMAFARKYAPSLKLHLSTQANTTNKYSAAFWAEQGAVRIVLARELTLEQIAEIRAYLPPSVELEAFVHGAMCISYSGRCLLSNFMTGRRSNHGECAQCCRWDYALVEKSRGEAFDIEEDARGTYILNSRDMNMIGYIDRLAAAGITSFKVEGRVKSPYYVAGVVNAYRRALDAYQSNPALWKADKILSDDLDKISHRKYCTGFYLGERETQCYDTSKPRQSYDFCAMVVSSDARGAIVEQRNRFKKGDVLEVLSPDGNFNRTVTVDRLETEDGAAVTDALNVQERLVLYTNLRLSPYDILRRKTGETNG